MADSGRSPPDLKHLICVICDDRSDGYHFDQPTCRACAAFFRRTVSHKLKYTCRRNGNCDVDKEVRNSCRACRYQKCLEQGMLPSAVQQKGQQKEGANGQQQQHATKLLPILVAIDRASLLEKDLLQMQHFAPPLYRSSSNSNGSANSYSEADSPWHCQPPLTISHQQQPQPPRPLTNLSRMLDGFHQFQSLKKGTYSTVEGLRQMPVEADGLYRSQYENYKKICKIVTSLAFDLVDRYFWPFGQLPTDEKLKLFGPFFKMFCNVCRSFRTANRFPPGDDRLFMPDGVRAFEESHLLFTS